MPCFTFRFRLGLFRCSLNSELSRVIEHGKDLWFHVNSQPNYIELCGDEEEETYPLFAKTRVLLRPTSYTHRRNDIYLFLIISMSITWVKGGGGGGMA